MGMKPRKSAKPQLTAEDLRELISCCDEKLQELDDGYGYYNYGYESIDHWVTKVEQLRKKLERLLKEVE